MRVVSVANSNPSVSFSAVFIYQQPAVLANRFVNKSKRSTNKVKSIVKALLPWFARNARDLPWRRTRDPYAIWVSEVMLQQTQVKTVIPYWERWMTHLPRIVDLAGENPETVLKLWEGLGYYTRARNLQKAAQQIVAQHGGDFPENFDDVLALPGIGRYTAGAICSIAFDQATPILDGNVVRVLTRLFGISGNPRDKFVNDLLWALSQDFVSNAAKATRAGNWRCSRLNQALMELGALICTPSQPRCSSCPLCAHCAAHATGQVENLPALEQRIPQTARRFAAFVVEYRGRVLVRQRPAGVVNAHLWEFPNLELESAPSHKTAAAFLELPLTRLQPLCVIKHSITRYRITLDAYSTRLTRRPATKPVGGHWHTWEEANRLPFASAHRKILRIRLEKGGPSIGIHW